MCLKSKLKEVFPAVIDFIIKQGRMKFVRPLYRLGYFVLILAWAPGLSGKGEEKERAWTRGYPHVYKFT